MEDVGLAGPQNRVDIGWQLKKRQDTHWKLEMPAAVFTHLRQGQQGWYSGQTARVLEMSKSAPEY